MIANKWGLLYTAFKRTVITFSLGLYIGYIYPHFVCIILLQLKGIFTSGCSAREAALYSTSTPSTIRGYAPLISSHYTFSEDLHERFHFTAARDYTPFYTAPHAISFHRYLGGLVSLIKYIYLIHRSKYVYVATVVYPPPPPRIMVGVCATAKRGLRN